MNIKLRDNITLLENKLLEIKDKNEFKDKRKKLREWIRKQNISKEELKIVRQEIKDISEKVNNRKKAYIASKYNLQCGIYIVHIGYHPQDIYKIGMTDNLYRRLKEIDNTSVIGGVELIDFFPTDEPITKEKEIHKKLKNSRIQIDREFFQGNINYFRDIIKDTIN